MNLAATILVMATGIGGWESRVDPPPYPTEFIRVHPRSIVVDAAAVAQRLTAELSRVEKGATEVGGDNAQTILTLVQRARKAAEASRLYLALDDMQDAWTIESGLRFRASHKAITTDAEFGKLWQSTGKPKELAIGRPLPLVVVAIAQASASRAPATYMASKPYSEDSGIDAGLYHLGESRALTGFAEFCASLPFDRPDTAPAIGSIEKPLADLEAEAAKAYPAGVAPAIRQIFMRANVALKVARQLEGEKKHAAALQQLLVARYRLGQAAGPSIEVDRAAVGARIDEAAKRLKESRQDHSIAELFVQRARMLLETPDAMSGRSASVIADAVLPLYARYAGLQP